MYEISVFPVLNCFNALIAWGVELTYRGYLQQEWYYDAIFSRTLGEARAEHKAKKLMKKYNLDYYNKENC